MSDNEQNVSRAEKLERLKLLRENEKKKNIDIALASLDDLDKYLCTYKEDLPNQINNKKIKINNISNIIEKFNQLNHKKI
jgi:hypothetical protein